MCFKLPRPESTIHFQEHEIHPWVVSRLSRSVRGRKHLHSWVLGERFPSH